MTEDVDYYHSGQEVEDILYLNLIMMLIVKLLIKK